MHVEHVVGRCARLRAMPLPLYVWKWLSRRAGWNGKWMLRCGRLLMSKLGSTDVGHWPTPATRELCHFQVKLIKSFICEQRRRVRAPCSLCVSGTVARNENVLLADSWFELYICYMGGVWWHGVPGHSCAQAIVVAELLLWLFCMLSTEGTFRNDFDGNIEIGHIQSKLELLYWKEWAKIRMFSSKIVVLVFLKKYVPATRHLLLYIL